MKYRTKLFIVAGAALLILGGAVYVTFQQTKSVSYQRDNGLSARDGSNQATSTGQASARDQIADLPGTEDLSKDLFISYMVSKEATGSSSLTRTDRETLVRKVLNSYEQSRAENLPTHSSSDFTLTAAGAEEARSYGNTLGEAILNNTPEGELSSELQIFTEAIQSETPKEELKKLEPIIAGYRGLTEKVKTIPVPKDVVELHAKLATELDRHLLNITAMRNFPQDPIAGIIAFQKYMPTVKMMGESFQELQTYFTSYNITFQQHEGGSAIFDTI